MRRLRRFKNTIGNTAWVLLCAYTAVVSIICISEADDFWEFNDFWPVYEHSYDADFNDCFSLEEYFVYVIMPWLVVYFIKKGQKPTA